MSKLLVTLTTGGLAAILALDAEVWAQTLDRPWNFTPSNRGQMAIAMRQFDEARRGGGAAAVGAGATTIVCGGGSATATANNTCIILNNASGEILTDQAADGSTQDAASTATTTVNGETVTGADAVLSVLEGE